MEYSSDPKRKSTLDPPLKRRVNVRTKCCPAALAVASPTAAAAGECATLLWLARSLARLMECHVDRSIDLGSAQIDVST